MIEVQDIIKRFENNVVLNHVSCDMHDGQVNMIIGQSGSGKTVLMKCLIGLHKIDGGQILISHANGQDKRSISAMSESALRAFHREVGMLFQGAALFDSMSVLDNVMFPMRMFGNEVESQKSKDRFDETRMEERARFCLRRVNIPEHVFHLMPSEISGGQQKRVAIARAIVLNPKYLFCDEPNSGLDPKTSIVIDQLIHDITEEYNMCTIINSHDMNSIMEIGDNIVFLKNGNKEWQGSRHDIMHSNNEALDDFVFASELFKKVKSQKL